MYMCFYIIESSNPRMCFEAFESMHIASRRWQMDRSNCLWANGEKCLANSMYNNVQITVKIISVPQNHNNNNNNWHHRNVQNP